jgi:hypothetical protein
MKQDLIDSGAARRSPALLYEIDRVRWMWRSLMPHAGRSGSSGQAKKLAGSCYSITQAPLHGRCQGTPLGLCCGPCVCAPTCWPPSTSRPASTYTAPQLSMDRVQVYPDGELAVTAVNSGGAGLPNTAGPVPPKLAPAPPGSPQGRPVSRGGSHRLSTAGAVAGAGAGGGSPLRTASGLGLAPGSPGGSPAGSLGSPGGRAYAGGGAAVAAAAAAAAVDAAAAGRHHSTLTVSAAGASGGGRAEPVSEASQRVLKAAQAASTCEAAAILGTPLQGPGGGSFGSAGSTVSAVSRGSGDVGGGRSSGGGLSGSGLRPRTGGALDRARAQMERRRWSGSTTPAGDNI